MSEIFVRPVSWLLGTLLLSGCSPHPGSGNWLAAGANSDGFTQLQVHYDGKAELRSADESLGELHCFWQAMNEDTLDMVCSVAGDENARYRFQLQVVGERGGELHREGVLIGRFDRQPRQ